MPCTYIIQRCWPLLKISFISKITLLIICTNFVIIGKRPISLISLTWFLLKMVVFHKKSPKWTFFSKQQPDTNVGWNAMIIFSLKWIVWKMIDLMVHGPLFWCQLSVIFHWVFVRDGSSKVEVLNNGSSLDVSMEAFQSLFQTRSSSSSCTTKDENVDDDNDDKSKCDC